MAQNFSPLGELSIIEGLSSKVLRSWKPSDWGIFYLDNKVTNNAKQYYENYILGQEGAGADTSLPQSPLNALTKAVNGTESSFYSLFGFSKETTRWRGRILSAVFPGSTLFDYRMNGHSAITDAPTEDGKFFTLNKQMLPEEIQVTLAWDTYFITQGYIESQIRSLYRGLDRVVLCLPGGQGSPRACTCYGYETWRSNEGGVTLLKARLLLREILVASTAVSFITKSGKNLVPQDFGNQALQNVSSSSNLLNQIPSAWKIAGEA